MVLLWFLGDMARLVYYKMKEQPVQFFFGSGVALLIDIVILVQIAMYKKKPVYANM